MRLLRPLRGVERSSAGLWGLGLWARSGAVWGGGAGGSRRGVTGQRFFCRPDTRIQHFRAGVQGAPGRSLAGRRSRDLHLEFRVFLSDGVSEYTCGWARPCTWRHSQALGALFDRHHALSIQ